MYVKSLSLENFRKFYYGNNEVEFITSNDSKGDANIASDTTLIIGKNNSGKTTIIEGICKLIKEPIFKSTDFNFTYLKKLLSLYDDKYIKTENIEVPFLKFVITVGIDNNKEDLLTNIIPFMSIGDVRRSEVKISIKWEVKDKELFVKDLIEFNKRDFKDQNFDRFLELIDNSDYSLNYYDSNGNKVKNFSIKNLIDITPIKANNIKNDACLSEAFSKIVEYRYKKVLDKSIVTSLDDDIIDINKKLTENIKNNHTDNINNSLSKAVLTEKCQVLLKSDLSFQKLIKNVIKYEYVEEENTVPEQQFGLGYTNLMMIVADIITYMEKYPDKAFNSKINLISIEEPETYMHPQMQEQFIKNINDTINSLLENNNKNVNCQIIITTHSAHILSTKIHTGNTFDNINYVTNLKGNSIVRCLNDELIIGTKVSKAENEKLDELKFLKKHIKYKVSELFFADAVIFVEGITEYTLLHYYIDENPKLNKYYISVILINGAHGKVYENLIYALGIPTILVTDIDIERSESEKKSSLQIDKLKLGSRKTTNNTLKYFYNEDIVSQIMKIGSLNVGNLKVIFQEGTIWGEYATSFEEAFILRNINNKIVNEVLKEIKPNVYSKVIKMGGLHLNSYKLQKSLSESKSDFANMILYKMIICDEKKDIPSLPKYIDDGLQYIEKMLEER
ncbi:MAG: AAA family ATPase [Clostridium butyricum]|nr:AAA family ATPase [Clostridium butyricum]